MLKFYVIIHKSNFNYLLYVAIILATKRHKSMVVWYLYGAFGSRDHSRMDWFIMDHPINLVR